jgi:hypothetical protein
LDAAWSRADWPLVLAILDHLEAQGETCGAEPLGPKRYSALINYGAALEASGLVSLAVEQYLAALQINGRGREAIAALTRLKALPAPTSAPCEPAGVLPAYEPTAHDAPVTLLGRRFGVDSRPWLVKGINYYPPASPWDKFLPELDLAEVDGEWKLISAAGFNTIRIFLWYDPLFTCEPETATPIAAAFERLDGLMALAQKHHLRLIVTLHDLPDLDFRPLYTDWERYDAQTAFIVARYREEPVILAWDLRNEGDLDYGASGYHTVAATKAEVLAWLAHAAEVVHEQSPLQLVTAGWWGDPTETSSAVDFLSFHHWGPPDELHARLDGLSRATNHPLLVEEIGYHSWASAPGSGLDETQQAELLGAALGVLAASDVAGWVLWTAFDFVPASNQAEGYEHHFGLWRTDLTPKPALETVRAYLEGQPQ